MHHCHREVGYLPTHSSPPFCCLQWRTEPERAGHERSAVGIYIGPRLDTDVDKIVDLELYMTCMIPGDTKLPHELQAAFCDRYIAHLYHTRRQKPAILSLSNHFLASYRALTLPKSTVPDPTATYAYHVVNFSTALHQPVMAAAIHAAACVVAADKTTARAPPKPFAGVRSGREQAIGVQEPRGVPDAPLVESPMAETNPFSRLELSRAAKRATRPGNASHGAALPNF